MRTLLVTFLALFLLAPVADHAEAGKRFGGGSKLGKSFTTQKKVAPTASSTTQNKTASGTTANATQATNATKTAAAAPKKRSGFGGLMAGLLGAGLLGALFFGGAFDGIEIMDILLIALVAFIGWKLFTMRKKASSPAPAYASAGGAPYTPEPQPVQPQPEPQPAAKQSFEPMPSASSASFAAADINLPEWFNKDAFLDGARTHFAHLQAAWDNQDWDDIATYTSPELLQELKAERAKLEQAQHTEVVSVMTELVGFTDNGDHVVVSINFYGWLREDAEETTEFNEIWHLTRDMNADNADWLIVGIEQP